MLCFSAIAHHTNINLLILSSFCNCCASFSNFTFLLLFVLLHFFSILFLLCFHLFIASLVLILSFLLVFLFSLLDLLPCNIITAHDFPSTQVKGHQTGKQVTGWAGFKVIITPPSPSPCTIESLVEGCGGGQFCVRCSTDGQSECQRTAELF